MKISDKVPQLKQQKLRLTAPDVFCLQPLDGISQTSLKFRWFWIYVIIELKQELEWATTIPTKKPNF